jgi:hypothetical protein
MVEIMRRWQELPLMERPSFPGPDDRSPCARPRRCTFTAVIAGQARARNTIMVARNTREFGRLPGLRLADRQQ